MKANKLPNWLEVSMLTREQKSLFSGDDAFESPSELDAEALEDRFRKIEMGGAVLKSEVQAQSGSLARIETLLAGQSRLQKVEPASKKKADAMAKRAAQIIKDATESAAAKTKAGKAASRAASAGRGKQRG